MSVNNGDDLNLIVAMMIGKVVIANRYFSTIYTIRDIFVCAIRYYDLYVNEDDRLKLLEVSSPQGSPKHKRDNTDSSPSTVDVNSFSIQVFDLRLL